MALAGLAAVLLPTLLSTAREHWSNPEGSQGPIILATGLWLLWRARSEFAREAAPIEARAAPLLLIPPALAYAFARSHGILSVETAMAYLLFVVTALLYLGPALLRRHWFSFAYFTFLIVLPPTFVVELTQPLRLWISSSCVELFYQLGYPVALSGATIQIAQYALLVKVACAGMNSMLTLCAIGLFYVHLRAAGGVCHSALLLLAIVPIAIAANFARVALLILLTWYFGAAVAQGLAHDSAGLLMFLLAMAGMFVADAGVSAIAGARRTRCD